MSKLKNFFTALVGLRKILFSILAILLVAFGIFVVTVLFLTSWYYNAKLIDGATLASVYISGFQWIATIAGGYLAINVANKYVNKLLQKRNK